MKKSKILTSVVTGLIISATAVGASALTACKPKKPEEPAYEGKTYYVSPDGKFDSAGTAEDPMDVRTLINFEVANASDAVLKPGDTVIFKAGDYNFDSVITIGYSGEHNKYITFKAEDPTKKTTLKFYDVTFDSTHRGVQIDGDYILWQGIDVCGAGDNGLYIGGSYNIVENCEFYDNRDTGLQLGRSFSEYASIEQWPSYNLVRNCTSYNNYDNETYGENADGFAAKLTVGYHNVFDGCIAYRNSDDGWDLYAKAESGNIGAVIMYNCVAFENGYIMETQEEFNKKFPTFRENLEESNTYNFCTRDGDGNGFKLGGGKMEGDVVLVNSLAFNNRMHGVTDNSNPGIISLKNVTSYNNSAVLDTRSHLDIHDANGKTFPRYHAVDSDGYIVYQPVNNVFSKAIVDESGNCENNYATLDDNGYILDEDGNFANGAQTSETAIKGTYIKAAANLTVNSEFGHVVLTSGKHVDDGDGHGNIDVARESNCYGNLANVLAINNGAALQDDRFRGSAEYSILSRSYNEETSKYESFKITQSIDADATLNFKAYTEEEAKKFRGEIITSPVAEEIFAKLPAKDLGFSKEIHKTMRNADGSINFGDTLKIKDYSKLLGDDHKIGCDLTKGSWADYSHYAQTDLTAQESETKATIAAVADSLYIPANVDSVYQDFHVLVGLYGATVTWTSSDESVLKVTDKLGPDPSYSGYKYVDVTVHRNKEGDKKVKLTANISLNGETAIKEFELNVIKAQPAIGEISVEGVNGGLAMYDYSVTPSYSEPKVTVYDASDYNGKTLPQEMYTVETLCAKYNETTGKYEDVLYLDMNTLATQEGLYQMTQKVTLTTDSSKTSSVTYKLYVVSAAKQVEFKEAPEVAVNLYGYTVKGSLTGVKGSVYTLTKPAGSAAPSAQEVIAGNNKQEFSATDSINFQFENANSGAYDIYTVALNPAGDKPSSVYKASITTQNVNTKEQLNNLVKDGGSATTIYNLTADMDYTGATWARPEKGKSFKGYIDGKGHTVKGISLNGPEELGMFGKFEGGTLTNINFENIRIESSANKVGIVATVYGGYFRNIKLKNIFVSGTDRVGGLIGQIFEGDIPVVIEKVSLENDISTASRIVATNKRAGGLVGFIQFTSSPAPDQVINVTIKNCLVNSEVDGTNGQGGGIVAEFDNNAGRDDMTLTISYCFFTGVVKAKSRCGGILGYQGKTGVLRIDRCAVCADIYHAEMVAPLEAAQKNSSCIQGGYNAVADAKVTNCFGIFPEHNANSDVAMASRGMFATKKFWTENVKFDMENVWEFTEETDGKLAAPYIRLK